MNDAGRGPAVSVVIPLLNGEQRLREQLAALSRESVDGGFEVVIADNGSTDDSRAVANAFFDRIDMRIIDASATRAHGFARNEGARVARSDNIVFLDHDDVIMPGYLEAMARALRHSDFVAARVDTGALNQGWLAEVRSVPQAVGLGEGPLPWAYGGTLGIRRSVFEMVGGFDTSLGVSAEDVDLCWRVQEAGIALRFVPDAVLQYRFPETYRGLWRQGRRYGLGQTLVDRRHRDQLPAVGESFRSRARGFAGSLRLVCFGTNRTERGRGLFLLGRRIGRAQGFFGRVF